MLREVPAAVPHVRDRPLDRVTEDGQGDVGVDEVRDEERQMTVHHADAPQTFGAERTDRSDLPILLAPLLGRGLGTRVDLLGSEIPGEMLRKARSRCLHDVLEEEPRRWFVRPRAASGPVVARRWHHARVRRQRWPVDQEARTGPVSAVL